MNEFADTINDSEEKFFQISKNCDEWFVMFDSVINSYTDAEELLHSCKMEIAMLLEILKQHGIKI